MSNVNFNRSSFTQLNYRCQICSEVHYFMVKDPTIMTVNINDFRICRSCGCDNAHIIGMTLKEHNKKYSNNLHYNIQPSIYDTSANHTIYTTNIDTTGVKPKKEELNKKLLLL